MQVDAVESPQRSLQLRITRTARTLELGKEHQSMVCMSFLQKFLSVLARYDYDDTYVQVRSGRRHSIVGTSRLGNQTSVYQNETLPICGTPLTPGYVEIFTNRINSTGKPLLAATYFDLV